MMSTVSSKAYGSPETRTRILEAAWKLVEESGAGIRLANVAERAGVSRQALYLHFGDRSGLLMALVDYVDKSQGWSELRSHIFGAPSGVESLRRWVEAMGSYTARIDQITQAVEANQYQDEAIADAWRKKMSGRQSMILTMMERISGEGALAAEWDVVDAANVVYVYTMPGPWRELTRELGWSIEKYASTVWRLLSESLLVADDRVTVPHS